MVTQFFFAKQDRGADTGISGFSFTVRTDNDKPHEAYQSMEAQALQSARAMVADGEISPTFIGHAGIPDLQMVLQGGTVKAIFYRNANLPPSIVVHDLDYADDMEKMLAELSHEVQQSGYTRCVFLEPSPGD